MKKIERCDAETNAALACFNVRLSMYLLAIVFIIDANGCDVPQTKLQVIQSLDIKGVQVYLFYYLSSL